MKKKILVTGASGFVGSHFVEAASAAGYEVHALVRKSSQIDGISTFVAKFLYPDLEDGMTLSGLFHEEHYEFVVHAAALTKAKTQEQMMAVNVGVTERLIEAAFQSPYPPKRFVFVSSLAAIGPLQYGEGLITEDTAYNPVTIYGKSKQAAEEMLSRRFPDKPITVVRPTAVYGPREKDLFILFNTMYKGLDAYIGKAPQNLTFVYVRDLVNLLLLACERPQHGMTVFNITDGNIYSRYDMADIFKRLFRRRLFRVHVPLVLVEKVAKFSQWLYRKSEKTPVIYPERLRELTAQNWGCDISKAKSELGYKPAYDLERGLHESLLWYKDNNWF
ncbi:nucleoside-diphosphate-sugar epimerase [Sphingobacterium allocomposti]|uniref:Nucleoside-diphosphate-sugar epimerase n=1 Tax=Sphingobacterium allocomposti TaxID=415956 RepID=A0A5S5DMM4_9SPHI|nr:NAD(P)-dependent oxidoreductase [Sphingobacterium composti Yoo et al. 2007 non Ten et al. 2007]TYP96296.1 nucleoside-diphosphate-sugar epimerase [Sphingobacterium composti Yoo et al. 2007 non Ten et al. 2007]